MNKNTKLIIYVYEKNHKSICFLMTPIRQSKIATIRFVKNHNTSSVLSSGFVVRKKFFKYKNEYMNKNMSLLKVCNFFCFAFFSFDFLATEQHLFDRSL